MSDAIELTIGQTQGDHANVSDPAAVTEAPAASGERIAPVVAANGFPAANGLYDPNNEKDSCGVGFIAHLKGERSHQIVTDALVMLSRMDHRGGCGCEANTGDGAGIMTALPHDFLRKVAKRDANIDLPEADRFAAGIVFLPSIDGEQQLAKQTYENTAKDQGLEVLGWRVLPVDPDAADVGPTARTNMPHKEQLFLGAPEGMDAAAFDRKLFITRKLASHTFNSLEADLQQRDWFYTVSLSRKLIVYKGQLTSAQVPMYYLDLQDEDYTSHLAMVHSRFSTNTFPSWARAQPCRWMSHNGEINTIRGNKNWFRARQGLMESALLGEDLEKLYPIINEEASDSGSFDNAFELLMMAGRSVPEAMMMMIPEAWENHESMPLNKRAFYEYHANLIEPWDGPASVSFTDGKYIGATLDRNGLRPSRYYVTHDDRVIMASEVGVVDVDPANVKSKGRLQPGRMFLVNFEEGRVISDEELKNDIAAQRPYGQWLQEQRITLGDMHQPSEAELTAIPADGLLAKLQAFGYTTEHLNMVLAPMVNSGKEALGSMGNDAALAVLSDKPRLLYDYFKQLFAQVTNPPVDPIREEIIMSVQSFIGPEGNLLETTESQCHRLYLEQPLLTNTELAAIKRLGDFPYRGWRSREIDITYTADESDNLGGALEAAIQNVCDEATQAIDQGYQLIVLSDRAAGPGRVPISSLLAVGAVHQHLVRTQSRTKIGIVLESGEAREIHHFCLLFGFGCDAVNPYLAYESLYQLQRDGLIDPEMSREKIVSTFAKVAGKGIYKVMSKMGISTLASYKGAQIFEALGLGEDVIARCFTGAASRLKGVDFAVLDKEARRRHALGFPGRDQRRLKQLPNPGEYHWRANGEAHAFAPQSIADVQIAARTGSKAAYDKFAQATNDSARQRCTLRGLMKLQTEKATPISIDEVESAADIVKRFRTGAMSLGALSKEAHETLALAMNRIGGYSNSGEGGEDPDRFAIDQYEDGSTKSRRSAIKQVASGRFGVRSYYLANADMLQIKVAQGAKPGEGGQLPGHKVSDYIGRLRYSTPGVGLISPPPHHDIYSIEDLAQLIFDLKNSNPVADVSVKLVAEVGVGTIAAGVAKAKADHILISGHDGGTAASPLTSIKHAGLPWELGLAETHQTLVLNDLRSRIRLETDGGMRTGRDVVIAACLGAEEYGFSTIPLVTIGCIMMRKCHLNTCPVGVCTQDPVLRKKFNGQPEHVINYLFLVAEEARAYMAELGVRTIDELVGRSDLLDTNDAIEHWKADGLDLSPILKVAEKPTNRENVGVRKLMQQDHGIELVLDNKLIEGAKPALENGDRVEIGSHIVNTDRAVGTMLSYHVSKNHGDAGLPEDTLRVNFTGSAGQSFGGFLAPGVTFNLEGDANDYLGKGLSGGKLIVAPPKNSSFAAEDNIIAGNVCFYGATGGEAYVRGIAAERFCVRNSGVRTVVEGVGDHGCEYMTGGRVVILGPTGRNFAAGMSGGIAYIYDPNDEFIANCNLELVDLDKLEDIEDVAEVKTLISRHLEYTGSTVADKILNDWDNAQPNFVKVMPRDYRKVLLRRKAEQAEQDNDPTEVGHG